MARFVLPKPGQVFTGDDARLRNTCARFIALDDAIKASASGEHDLSDGALGRIRDAWWDTLEKIETILPKTKDGAAIKLTVGYRALVDQMECEYGKAWRVDGDLRSRVAVAGLMETLRVTA